MCVCVCFVCVYWVKPDTHQHTISIAIIKRTII